jgi:hypothetical protein
MLRLILAASVAVATCAPLRAATPAEDAYFAAREAAVARVKAAADAKKSEEAVQKLDDEGREGLLRQLSELVGPQKPKGYDKGELAPNSLEPDSPGSGQLDAIIYAKGEDDPSVSVTTEGVADHWVSAIRADPEHKDVKLPATLPEAMKTANFYTLAIGGEAAFALYAPVPATGDAVALLGAFAQDVGPAPPSMLVVSVRRGGLLYVIQARPATEPKVPTACEAVWKTFERKAEAAQKAYQASGEKDQAQLDAAQQSETEGDEAWRQCFSKEIKPEDAAALGRQADDLLKLLP